MKNNLPNGKKITRGIDEKFADAFKGCELYKLYKEHTDELFIGVRNDYLNLYYNCDSIAKVEYKNSNIRCIIDKYYIDGKHYGSKEKEKRYKIEPDEIYTNYDKLIKHSNLKASPRKKEQSKQAASYCEKKAQSKLVISNNKNEKSGWFCIDIEYVKAFTNKAEKKAANFSGRFDIIAVSRQTPHRVALIELKYGRGAIGGDSGIYKHISDFSKFCEKGYFQSQLKREIVDIIQSLKYLDIEIPFKVPEINSIAPNPEFYFITLDNNPDKESKYTPKQTMAGYLFDDYRWDCRKLSRKKPGIECKYGDVTKKKNKFHATFLFSTETIEKGIKINDIIDGKYDERIIPS